MLYFIFLLPTKKSCIEIKNKIQKFLTNELHLSLNNKSKYYPYKMGVNFCGYRIFTTHRLLRVSSKKKIKKNIKTWNICYKKNELNTSLALQSLNSWLGHSSHCNSYKLQQKILNNCNFIVNSNYYNSIENSLIELIEADNKNFCLRPQNHDPKIMNYENEHNKYIE